MKTIEAKSVATVERRERELLFIQNGNYLFYNRNLYQGKGFKNIKTKNMYYSKLIEE